MLHLSFGACRRDDSFSFQFGQCTVVILVELVKDANSETVFYISVMVYIELIGTQFCLLANYFT
jgi:hypothetical protein